MRVKVNKNVVRHNRVEYGVNDVFDLDDKSAKRLIDAGFVVETNEPISAIETSSGEDVFEFDTDVLTEKQINYFKQKELVKIAASLNIHTDDKKSATLKSAIIEHLFDGDIVNLDEMNLDELRDFAEEEEIVLPDDADEDTVRDILTQALGN